MKSLKHFYVSNPLTQGDNLKTPEALAKRLAKVLRLKEGNEIALFNGKDGLFLARLENNKATILSIQQCLKPFEPKPEVTLLTALLKKDAFDRVLRQATEMGVTTIQPLLTDFTVPDALNVSRATTRVVEAAEQCERLCVPTLLAPCTLQQAIEQQAGKVFWCAEHVGGRFYNDETPNPQASDAVLVGPEGGFSPTEREWLMEQKKSVPVGLGNTILKADTAVVAALSRFYEKL